MMEMKYKCIVLFIFLFLPACAHEYEYNEAIRIAYLPITHSMVVMLMGRQEPCEIHSFEIELVRFTTWPDVVDALRTGRVHGASILFEVALQARETDDSLSLVSLTHRDGNVIVVDNSIETYSDLIGRTVAIPHRLSPQHTLLQILLEREGISPEDIDIIEISPAEMPFTMASGAIAAYLVAEPFGSVAEFAGVGRIMETSDEISPNSVCCVMIFRDMDNDPVLSDWLMRSFREAAAEAYIGNEEILRVFRQHSNANDEVIRQSFEHISFGNLNLSYEEFNIITSQILHHGIMEQVPGFNDFVRDW